MENNFAGDGHPGPEGQPSTYQAREALDLLNDDGARLAERMQTPWWYHPVVGFFAAVFVGAQAAPGAASTIALALGVVGLTVFTTSYGRRFGISIERPAGPRTRRLLFLSVAVVLIGMVVAVFFAVSALAPWWGLVPAAVVFGATIVLGRRYETALRVELSRNGEVLA